MKDARVDSFLSFAQSIATLVLVLGAATVAYLVGSRIGAKHGQPGAGGTTAGAAASVDVATLMVPTPEMIQKGAGLYMVNCSTCHGMYGLGDGPAAAALNPKPRNFVGEPYRYGGGVARIVQTISTGSAGTAMAAFTAIPMEDRFALAHYIRTLGTTLAEDTPADLAWLTGGGGTPGGAGGAAAGAPAPGPTLPLEVALKLAAEPAPPVGTVVAQVAGPAADLYAARCASCHGVAGEGGVRVRMIGSAPYAYIITASFAASRGGWASDPARFEKLLVEGLPGFVMPGNGDLSRGEIRDLYQYTLKLREQQGGGVAMAKSAPSRS